MTQLTILAVAASLTAAVSAIIGMGGGILLLATMFCFLPHADAIPTHAAVQLVSNTTRVLGFLPHVDWSTVGRFSLGALPGAVLGALVLWSLGEPGDMEPYLKMLVGAYVLVMPFVPRGDARTGWHSRWAFTLVGLVAGTAGLTVGAIGPIIAPLFTRGDFVKERLVATKATCQMIIHLTKIPAFLLVRDLNYGRLGALAIVMCVMVIPGTLIGKGMLKHVTEAQFVRLYRVALLVAGVKVFCYDGLWQLYA